MKAVAYVEFGREVLLTPRRIYAEWRDSERELGSMSFSTVEEASRWGWERAGQVVLNREVSVAQTFDVVCGDAILSVTSPAEDRWIASKLPAPEGSGRPDNRSVVEIFEQAPLVGQSGHIVCRVDEPDNQGAYRTTDVYVIEEPADPWLLTGRNEPYIAALKWARQRAPYVLVTGPPDFEYVQAGEQLLDIPDLPSIDFDPDEPPELPQLEPGTELVLATEVRTEPGGKLFRFPPPGWSYEKE